MNSADGFEQLVELAATQATFLEGIEQLVLTNSRDARRALQLNTIDNETGLISRGNGWRERLLNTRKLLQFLEALLLIVKNALLALSNQITIPWRGQW